MGWELTMDKLLRIKSLLTMMADTTLDTGTMNCKWRMAKEFKLGQMVTSMMVIGNKINSMVMDYLHSQMVKSMMETGKTTRCMDLELNITVMVVYMMVNLKMVCNMDLVLYTTLME